MTDVTQAQTNGVDTSAKAPATKPQSFEALLAETKSKIRGGEISLERTRAGSEGTDDAPNTSTPPPDG